MALKAALITILLYVGWGVVMWIGVGIILSMRDIVGLAAGGLIVVFGLAMALLSATAVMIKISVGEATNRAGRRMETETRRAETRATSPDSRPDPTISERPSPFAEMTLKDAYGAALKAALGIIGFYIAAGGVMLVGSWIFGNSGGFKLIYGLSRPTPLGYWWDVSGNGIAAGIAVVVLGMILAWLSAFAVIIKVSVGEAARRSARRIDESAMRAANRVEGRNESPARFGQLGGGGMSWPEAFGVSVKATLWIIAANIAISLLTGVCAALVADGGAVGALLGLAAALFFAACGILCPFAIIIGYSVTIAEKRSDRRINAAVRFMADSLDARAASPPDSARAQ